MNKHEKELLCYYLRKADRYEPVKKVGEGAYGSIQLVKDKETEKVYAKKNVPFPSDDETAPLYFFREFLSLKSFQIDGLPFLKLEGFNFPEGEEQAFIITEFVEGGSLSSLIHDRFKKCSDIPTTRMIIIFGIAFAIKVLHSQKIVHRDLKPENILLNTNKEPILADFGFARLISDSNIFVTGKLGTLMYMAPELLTRSEIEGDCSIDVYAFAVLLFQILYGPLRFEGKSPYTKANERAFMKHIIRGGRFDLPAEGVIPDNFLKLITDCWSQKPSERWPMKKVVKVLKTSDYILEGTDLDKYNQYVERLTTIYSNSKKKTEEEETIEYTAPFDF